MVNFVGLFKILLATNLQILGRPRIFLNIDMKSVEKSKFSFRRRRLFGGQPIGP